MVHRKSSSDVLRVVDPTGRRRLGVRVYTACLGTVPGRWVAMNIAPKVDPWLMGVTRGRIGMALMLPSTLLVTTGAKSGMRRTSAVLYFHDGQDVIVVASSFGRDKHPAWYHNLKADPRVSVGAADGGLEMIATEVTAPDERRRLWSLADRVYPLFRDYRERAASSKRTIPIIRLSAS